MRFSVNNSIVACLTIITLLLTAGCGSKDDTGPPAATDRADAEQHRQSTETPSGKPAGDPLHPVVVVETSLGDIIVRLDAENSPLTVDNFLAYVDSGHYDQTIFHQVLQDYPRVVIGGAFTSELTEKPVHTPIRNEAHNKLSHRRGTIAMARQPEAVDSATCHFFFNVTDNEKVLDHKDRTLEGYGYCVFGEVVEGLDVVDKIAEAEVHDKPQFEQIPVQTVLIRSVRRVK